MTHEELAHDQHRRAEAAAKALGQERNKHQVTLTKLQLEEDAHQATQAKLDAAEAALRAIRDGVGLGLSPEALANVAEEALRS